MAFSEWLLLNGVDVSDEADLWRVRRGLERHRDIKIIRPRVTYNCFIPALTEEASRLVRFAYYSSLTIGGLSAALLVALMFINPAVGQFAAPLALLAPMAIVVFIPAAIFFIALLGVFTTAACAIVIALQSGAATLNPR